MRRGVDLRFVVGEETAIALDLLATSNPLPLKLLEYLKEHGPSSPSTIARDLGEPYSNVRYHANRLAEHLLITFRRGKDRRRKYYVLTKKGQLVLDTAKEITKKWFEAKSNEAS